MLAIVWQEKGARRGLAARVIQALPRRESGDPICSTARGLQMNARLAHKVIDLSWGGEPDDEWLPNGLEMSRPASL